MSLRRDSLSLSHPLPPPLSLCPFLPLLHSLSLTLLLSLSFFSLYPPPSLSLSLSPFRFMFSSSRRDEASVRSRRCIRVYVRVGRHASRDSAHAGSLRDAALPPSLSLSFSLEFLSSFPSPFYAVFSPPATRALALAASLRARSLIRFCFPKKKDREEEKWKKRARERGLPRRVRAVLSGERKDEAPLTRSTTRSLHYPPRKTKGRTRRREPGVESAISEGSDPCPADFSKTIYSFVVCVIRNEGSS